MILVNGTLAQADFATELLSPARFPFTAIPSSEFRQHFTPLSEARLIKF